jgi:hypothetical protein
MGEAVALTMMAGASFCTPLMQLREPVWGEALGGIREIGAN